MDEKRCSFASSSVLFRWTYQIDRFGINGRQLKFVVLKWMVNTVVPNLGEFPLGENRWVARGNGGLPRLGHSFHLIVTGIAFP